MGFFKPEMNDVFKQSHAQVHVKGVKGGPGRDWLTTLIQQNALQAEDKDEFQFKYLESWREREMGCSYLWSLTL